jgi:hypothetical protein
VGEYLVWSAIRIDSFSVGTKLSGEDSAWI